MKFIGLVSGGKDSFFNIHHCISQGHELVALANLYPSNSSELDSEGVKVVYPSNGEKLDEESGEEVYDSVSNTLSNSFSISDNCNFNSSDDKSELDELDELDSFMFQTVGHELISLYPQCLSVPLFRRQILLGGSKNTNLEYSTTKNDEIELLFELLQYITTVIPDVKAVSSGAILSHYQRTRVENVCYRLNLTSLAFLWQRPQLDLMGEIVASSLDARLIKVAAIGLSSKNLGRSLAESFTLLKKLNSLYQVHICGEGGEFETLVFDASFFKKRIELVSSKIIVDGSNDVSYLKVLEAKIVDKTLQEFEALKSPPLLNEDFNDIWELLRDNESSMSQDSGIEKVSQKASSLLISDSSHVRLQPVITSTQSKFYISNLTSDEDLVESQLNGIFDQLQKILIANDSTLNDVQSVTLLVKDMSNFASINTIYSSYFDSYYLPPSRICITADITQDLQLSCIVLKPSTQAFPSKLGIHIRSRSYWAPHNIGPYSQSIVDQNEKYKIASISGQIPLIPSTMEFPNKGSTFDSVLSLQHFHKVKELIGVQKILSITCFIVDETLTKMVADTWNQYSDSNSLLIIAKVKSLPRNAAVEWGGCTFKPVIDEYADSDDEDDFLDEYKTLIASFEHKSLITVCPTLTTVTLLTNDVSNINGVIKANNNEHYLQILCSPKNIECFDSVNFEYLPAETVFNFEGTKFEYSLTWRIEKRV